VSIPSSVIFASACPHLLDTPSLPDLDSSPYAIRLSSFRPRQFLNILALAPVTTRLENMTGTDTDHAQEMKLRFEPGDVIISEVTEQDLLSLVRTVPSNIYLAFSSNLYGTWNGNSDKD
jgi:hypothetical protein